MFEPGYYKTNYRAVRLCEMIRWHGWRGGVRAWLRTRFKPMSRHATWMPRLWAENECKTEDLSPDFWQATKPHRTDFEKLGFVQCHLTKAIKKTDKLFDPSIRDSGGIFYIDSTRSYFGQLLYLRTYARETSSIHITFTAAFEHCNLTCTNHSITFDSANSGKIIRLNSFDVPAIYNRFREELQRYSETPRSFPDLESLRQWSDALKMKAFEDRVRRRLFVRMTEPEVVALWAERQRYPAGRPAPSPRRRLRLELMPTTLVVVLMVILMVLRHRNMPASSGGNTIAGDTIIYQGQQFKMSRSYAEYEDYKDDPNNLDTNDLGRIERTMEAVKIPASFKDSDDFIHFIFDLKFPGYGVGGIGASIQTDDGSTFDAESVEIPQMDKERVLVVRQEPGGGLKLVDDFVCDESGTNSISQVRLEHQQLEYFDQRGKIFRKKGI
jgi:hypothetical protein